MIKKVLLVVFVCGFLIFGFFNVTRLCDEAKDLEANSNSIENEIKDHERFGQLTLKLIDMEPNKKIKILINGHVEGYMDETPKRISAGDNSFIEIDASDIKKSFFVEVVGQSDNIKNNYIGQTIRVDETIAPIANISLK